MEFLGAAPTILFLALVAGIIYFIVSKRRGSEQQPDPGIGTVRRLYFYIVSYVALMVAANGMVQIIQYLLDSLFGAPTISPSRFRLAVGLALTIVGLPVWAWHWHLLNRYVRELPTELRSLVRKVYMYLVLGVSIGLVVAAGIGLMRWIFRVDSFGGYPWGALAVWGVVWVLHWRLEAKQGQPTPETLSVRRLYMYGATLGLLIVGATGLARVLQIVLLEGYEALVSLPVVLPSESGLWRTAMKESLGWAIVGGTAWAGHWLYVVRKDHGSVLRIVYLAMITTPGALVTVMVATGIVLFGVLTWGFGSVDEAAASHFRFLPAAVASLIMAVAIGGYHWFVVSREADEVAEERTTLRRSYVYLMAAIGLGALAAGIAALGSMALNILANSGQELLAREDIWRSQLALAITMGLLGAPLWGYFWTAAQRRVASGDRNEREALARRMMLFVAVGAGALALLGSLIHVLFVFIRAVLESELSRLTLADAHVTIGILIAVAIFLPYYWLVYRADRREEVGEIEGPRPRVKSVSILLRDGEGQLATALERALGYRVSVLTRADEDAPRALISEQDLQTVVDRVGECPGANVLLIPEEVGIQVVSYD